MGILSVSVVFFSLSDVGPTQQAGTSAALFAQDRHKDLLLIRKKRAILRDDGAHDPLSKAPLLAFATPARLANASYARCAPAEVCAQASPGCSAVETGRSPPLLFPRC